ncbi:biotin--[acetyl-CoA-carboxylase] ligase [Candidatus Poriferisodalis sp.]|uniref:biotin--[acetyl-CoA-carboxylase] ligase n=1 Tax=Candidatus Poriferisodalis sp. TaxID=3101277 RepID=UPI003B014368
MPTEHEPWSSDSPRFASVAGTRFTDVEWHGEVSSTNAELLDRARLGASEGAVLIADVQTAGRGRRGRRWTAPSGTALMMSVLLRPPPDRLPPARAALVTLALALAAVDACEQSSGLRPRLKWPNDLVVVADAARAGAPSRGATRPDLKLAGILAESVAANGLLSALVVGMGLNTGWARVPAELEGAATSLNLASGAPVDRTTLARHVLEGLETRYRRLCSAGDAAGPEAVLDEARQNSATLGRRVRVTLGAPAGGPRAEMGSDTEVLSLEGVASDLDGHGRLLVHDDDGVIHAVAVGDVMHLRPAARER